MTKCDALHPIRSLNLLSFAIPFCAPLNVKPLIPSYPLTLVAFSSLDVRSPETSRKMAIWRLMISPFLQFVIWLEALEMKRSLALVSKTFSHRLRGATNPSYLISDRKVMAFPMKWPCNLSRLTVHSRKWIGSMEEM